LSDSLYSSLRRSRGATVPIFLLASAFQIRMLVSSLPESTTLASALNLTLKIRCMRLAWYTSRLLAALIPKMRIVRSYEPETNSRPVGEYATSIL
jgi:hypothetical protein